MATSSAELSLILRARDLASGTLGQVRDKISKIGDQFDVAGTKAGKFRDKLIRSFDKRAYRKFASGFGNLAQDLFSGGDLETSLNNFAGSFVAVGAAASASFVLGMGSRMIALIGGSALMASISGTLAALGASIGAVIAAAIPVGMALMPVILLAALVAAIIFLINNPKIVGQIIQFGREVVHNIVSALVGLGRALVGVFGAAFRAVFQVVRGIVGAIIGTIGGIITKISEALAALNLFHSRTAEESRNYHVNGVVPHNAAGGWVGLHGPELSWVGERGPEYIVPNHKLGAMGGGDTFHLNFTFPPTDAQMKVVVDAIDRYRYRTRATSGSGNRF